MPLDPETAQANRAASTRMRALADRLSDEELRRPVGEHWTVAVVFAHLAFWDQRPLGILQQVVREGRLEERVVDPVANDYALKLWLAIPPREAVRIALEATDELDARLETASDETIATILAHNPRWVRRHLHRNEHLDEAEAALRG